MKNCCQVRVAKTIAGWVVRRVSGRMPPLKYKPVFRDLHFRYRVAALLWCRKNELKVV